MELEREPVLPVFFRQGKEIRSLGGARVVDQQVETAESSDGSVNNFSSSGGIAKVGGQDLHFDAGFIDQACGNFLQFCQVAGDKKKIHPFPGKFRRDGGSNAAVRPCNQRNLLVKCEFHVPPRSTIHEMMPLLSMDRKPQEIV